METVQTSHNPIIDGPIWKALLSFFFPIMVGTFFQQLYNTADTIIVGQCLGKTALAAVGGTTGVIIMLVVHFFVNLSSGASVVISQFYGAQKKKELADTLHTAVALSFVGGLLLSVIGYFVLPTVLVLLKTPSDVYPLAVTYIRVYFAGMIPVLFYNIGSAILRALGDSKRPLYFLIVACVINIILDLLFVQVFSWGIGGAAFATILSQLISAILIFICLMHLDPEYSLKPSRIRFHRHLLSRILFIGFPSGIQSTTFSLSNLMVQVVLNGFGTDVIAAWTVFSKLNSLNWMGLNALNISITTFSGQNYGARKLDRIRKCTHVGIVMASIYCLFLTFSFVCFGRPLTAIFTSDPSVMHYTKNIIMGMAPYYITYIFVEIYSGAIRGTGNTIFPMLITIFGVCGLRVLWILFIVPVVPTLECLIFCYPVTWAVTSLLFIIYYKFGKWLK